MLKKTIPLPLTLLVLLGAAPLIAACHTMAGAGEDISRTGDAIGTSAKKNTP